MKPIVFGSIIIASLFLVGCNSKPPPVVTVPQLQVIDIPEDMFKCDTVRLPDPSTLTNRELSRLIVRLTRANSDCRNSMKGIQTFIEKAKERVEIDNAELRKLNAS